MYIPSWFKEDRLSVLQDAIDHISFGSLVTMTKSGMIASHIPMIVNRNNGESGTIRGHLARANMQWRDTLSEVEGLAIFVGPEAYISPSWYKTKGTGKVVPTWNYIAVHAVGTVHFITDTECLRDLVTKLTEKFEDGSGSSWKVSDAQDDYINQELKGIVGFDMPIRKIEGKWKMGQNRIAADRKGAIKGLRERDLGQDREVAQEMQSKDDELVSKSRI